MLIPPLCAPLLLGALLGVLPPARAGRDLASLREAVEAARRAPSAADVEALAGRCAAAAAEVDAPDVLAAFGLLLDVLAIPLPPADPEPRAARLAAPLEAAVATLAARAGDNPALISTLYEITRVPAALRPAARRALAGLGRTATRPDVRACGMLAQAELLAADSREGPVDPDERRQMVDLLARVEQDFGSARTPFGPVGELARGTRFELEHLYVGATVPPLSGEDLHGRPFDLADYRGKVVALVFWGQWCVNCRAEFPHLRSLAGRHGSERFALVGVNSDPDRARIAALADQGEFPWPSFWNGAEGPDGPLARGWNVRRWPTLFLLDGAGRIRGKNRFGAELDAAIAALLAEQG